MLRVPRLVSGVCALAICAGLAGCGKGTGPAPAPSAQPSGPPTVTLNPEQLKLISVDRAGERDFVATTSAPGIIDFDQNSNVQVLPPYQGKIVQTFAQLGDAVARGQPLYSIESPDLVAASATLLSAEATEAANRKALDRARKLHETQGISDQNLEAAVQAEAASDAALQAARGAIAVFGKSASAILAARKVDSVLVVRSPIAGIVTARSAQPGLLVQPATSPAPFAVGASDHMWMLANAAETDAARFHVGQRVDVRVNALPGESLGGRIETIAASVDPATHTVQLRASIADPQHRLRAGMIAAFAVHTGTPARSVAVPAEGVVREGDGTETVWVTTDRRHYTQRVVQVGLTRDGYDQIVAGLNPGEMVVTRGAIFIDNMLAADPDA